MSSLHIGARRRNGLRQLEKRVSRLEKLILEILQNQKSATGQVRAQWEHALKEFEERADKKEQT